MKKPLILLSAEHMMGPDYDKLCYTEGFATKAILRAGGMPISSDYLGKEDAHSLMSRVDGLYLTGGPDICPLFYDEKILPCCGDVQPNRDISDLFLLQAAMELRKPVLCICRGFQLVNACLDGTLWQDLATQHPTDICHNVWSYPEYEGEGDHLVNVKKGTPLHKLLGEDSFGVNSLHHQAIKSLAPVLQAQAWSPDGIIESWYMPEEIQWMRGYQWHPEMQQENSHNVKIMEDFVNACIEHKS